MINVISFCIFLSITQSQADDKVSKSMLWNLTDEEEPLTETKSNEKFQYETKNREGKSEEYKSLGINTGAGNTKKQTHDVIFNVNCNIIIFL